MSIHMDHCVECVREILMCRPDISRVRQSSITTHEGWRLGNKDSVPHKCVNWTALNQRDHNVVQSLEDHLFPRSL